MRRFVYHWMPVIGYCALIFVQSSFPSYDPLPGIDFSDKLMHLCAYGVLAALFCRALNSIDRWRHRRRIRFILGVLAATAYGLSDEWH